MAARSRPSATFVAGAAPRVRSAAGPAPAPEPLHQALNEVRLLGRWAAAAARTLPSGDELVTARLVVPRADRGVDTIDCALWRPDLRRRALRLPVGSVVQVQGSLRRRFWRTPAGPASRYEIDVTQLRKAGAA